MIYNPYDWTVFLIGTISVWFEKKNIPIVNDVHICLSVAKGQERHDGWQRPCHAVWGSGEDDRTAEEHDTGEGGNYKSQR